MRIDDPVHCISTHGITGLWGVVVVGLVVEKHPLMSKRRGMFKGGSWQGLGVQVLAAVSITLWTLLTTFVQLFAIDKSIGLRMPREKEIDGADKWEHGIVMKDCVDHNISCLTVEPRAQVRRQWLKGRKTGCDGTQAHSVMSSQREDLIATEI